ncbi:hypothetical protein JW835_05895 [bacterium]|nr:hypothetical protein [bacterium]
MMYYLTTKTPEELIKARRYIKIGLVGIMACIIVVFISGFPMNLWTPDSFFKAVLILGILYFTGAVFNGLSIIQEDREVRNHKGGISDPIVNPASSDSNFWAGYAWIAAIIFLLRYLYLAVS